MTAAGGPLSRGWATLAAILVLAATAAAACDRGSTRAHPPPSPAVAGGALGRADVLLFKGDYLGAEAGYRKLAGGGDAHARAHLALLLAYESRYQESLAVAQQAVAARSDSEDLAILTRARDWAQDYDGALQSGAAALRAKPVSPLAHPFYAEVLADSGLYTAARRQLRLGQASARDRYARSEVDREWANLYRDEGDTAQELNYFQLSQRAQPAFPERTLELVRYEYQVGRSSAARTLLAGLQKRDSHAYWALESGAEAAQYLDGDATQATKLYQAALRAAPGAPTASLGLAELAANAHHFRAAHDLLLPVLKAHPDAGDVYLFLRYLDQLVLHIDPSADLASASSSAATQLAAAQAEALDRVNGYRVAAGLSPIPAGPGLAQGAEAHAYYVLFNWGAKQLAGLGIHSEAPSLPGFTGVNGLDRSRHFGYRGSRSSEVIDHVESPASAVETWVDAVYHRFPVLDREATGAGFGTASVGGLSVEVMELGLGAPAPGAPIVYPRSGQSGVPPQFVGNELPDPAPGARYPIGYPITIQAGGADTLSVTSASLRDAAGHSLPVFTDSPGPANPDLQPGQWAMLAKRPLTPGARYTADAAGSLDGRPFHERWSFTVLAG